MTDVLNYWELGAGLAAFVVPQAVLIYNQAQTSKWALHHGAVMRVWGLADDIATRIVAAIGSNPSGATRAQVIAAGVSELREHGAQALSQIVGGTSDGALTQLLSTRVIAIGQASPRIESGAGSAPAKGSETIAVPLVK